MAKGANDTNKKIMSVAIVLVMALSVTGAFLINVPGSSPDGPANGPLDESGGPVSGAADAVTVDIASDEQSGAGCTAPACPEEQDVSALTTIDACKSAIGYWERSVVYDWTVEKKVLDTEGVDASADGSYAFVALPLGETQTVQYQIVAERTVVSESDVMGVRGFVRVTNTGLWPTENLRIFDHVQMSSGCGYEDIAVFEVDTSANPVLCPGQSYCYAYEYEFEAEAGACYLNLAIVSITNMDAACDSSSVSACSGFSMPAEPVLYEVDENARLVEELQCPEGFECVIDDQGPWTLVGSRTFIVSVDVTNVDAPCGESFDLRNVVKLYELDTCQKHSDRAVVELGYECEEDESTTITVEKSIDGSWTRGVGYIWEVDKDVSPDYLYLEHGQTGTVTYTITVTRTAGEITDDVDIFGQITVANTGANPTSGLAVADTLYVTIEGVEQELAVIGVDISAKPVLAPGESYVYDYSFDVTDELLEMLAVPALPESLADLSFRNVASASITNFEGHEGSAYAVEDEASFTFSGSPELNEIDEEAVLTDLFDLISEGFTVTNTTLGPWTFNDGNLVNGQATVTWRTDITNVNADCSFHYIGNEANITASDTESYDADFVEVEIETPECEECGGCTLTIGYWKNHDGSGPQADDVTPLITIAGGAIWLGTANGAKSVEINTAAEAKVNLDRDGDSSNGINRLYAQLTAAKLNILNGACDDAVAGTIAAADAFLATHDAADWSSLTGTEQAQVNQWKDALDNYNNGVIGPGHCD